MIDNVAEQYPYITDAVLKAVRRGYEHLKEIPFDADLMDDLGIDFCDIFEICHTLFYSGALHVDADSMGYWYGEDMIYRLGDIDFQDRLTVNNLVEICLESHQGPVRAPAHLIEDDVRRGDIDSNYPPILTVK